jgi:hypothetical protein
VTGLGEMIRHNQKSSTLGLITSAFPAVLVAQVCPAVAADFLVVEPAPVVSEAAASAAFDVAFGVALANDYISRGIANSDSKPAVQPYIEASFEARRIWNG